MTWKPPVLTLLLLASVPTADAQFVNDELAAMGFEEPKPGPPPPSGAPGVRARKLARYRRFNDRKAYEAEVLARREAFFARQAIEERRDAGAAAASRAPRPHSDSPSYNRVPLSGPATRSRPDESGPYGYGGAPGPVPYSKNVRTGDVIPSAMIPAGMGRLYRSVDPR